MFLFCIICYIETGIETEIILFYSAYLIDFQYVRVQVHEHWKKENITKYFMQTHDSHTSIAHRTTKYL